MHKVQYRVNKKHVYRCIDLSKGYKFTSGPGYRLAQNTVCRRKITWLANGANEWFQWL